MLLQESMKMAQDVLQLQPPLFSFSNRGKFKHRKANVLNLEALASLPRLPDKTFLKKDALFLAFSRADDHVSPRLQLDCRVSPDPGNRLINVLSVAAFFQ